MTEIFRFNGNEVQALCEKARSHWETHNIKELPESWSLSNFDFSQLINSFPNLSVDPQYEIKAYQFRQGRDGETKSFAMPKGIELPPLEVDEEDEDEFLEPEKPDQALNDFMEAIEGDHTPWSYLCASILAREISEVGAFGHGGYWCAFEVLNELPPTKNGEIWQWQETQLENFSPYVQIDQTSIEVVFFTYCGLGSERITKHTDTYSSKKSYQFSSKYDVIATASGGYVW
jgi:hypothetical protein